MTLNDVTIRNLGFDGKSKKIADGDGLFLFISSAGTKSWHFRYRYLGKEQEITFGTYPEVSLLMARQKRFEARKLLLEGKTPSARKKKANVLLITTPIIHSSQ